MDRLKDFLQWNIENPYNLNFKMIVSHEDREDTLQGMRDMIELFNIGLTAEEIKEIFILISESQDDVDENGFSDGILRSLIQLQCFRNTGLTPEQIREIDKAFSEQAKELMQYKRAEEQGRLIWTGECDRCVHDESKEECLHCGRAYSDCYETKDIRCSGKPCMSIPTTKDMVDYLVRLGWKEEQISKIDKAFAAQAKELMQYKQTEE